MATQRQKLNSDQTVVDLVSQLSLEEGKKYLVTADPKLGKATIVEADATPTDLSIGHPTDPAKIVQVPVEGSVYAFATNKRTPAALNVTLAPS